MKTLLATVFLSLALSALSEAQHNPPYWCEYSCDFTDRCDTAINKCILKRLNLSVDSQSIWEVDKPSTKYFRTRFGTTVGLITDGQNPYPVNSHSYFDMVFLPSGGTYLELTHAYNTESDRDGLYITRSMDGGQTWTNIWKDEMLDHRISWVRFENMYDSTNRLYNGEYGFSGKTRNWERLVLYWQWAVPVAPAGDTLQPPADSLILRFNFISDSVNSGHDGWMIKEFFVGDPNVGTGLLESGKGSAIMVQPNPSKGSSILRFANPQNQLAVIQIFNSLGSMVHERRTRDSSYLLNLEGNYPGIYQVRIRLEDHSTQTGSILFSK